MEKRPDNRTPLRHCENCKVGFHTCFKYKGSIGGVEILLAILCYKKFTKYFCTCTHLGSVKSTQYIKSRATINLTLVLFFYKTHFWNHALKTRFLFSRNVFFYKTHLTCSVSNFQRMSSNSKFSSLDLNGQCELFWSI